MNHLAQDLRFPDSDICAQSGNMSRYLIAIPDAARGGNRNIPGPIYSGYIQAATVTRTQISVEYLWLRPPILLLSVSRYSTFIRTHCI